MAYIYGSWSTTGISENWFGIQPYRMDPFPYRSYYIDSDLPLSQSYYNNPSLDAVKLTLTLGGDADAWGDSQAYYELGLLTTTTNSISVSGGIVDLAYDTINLWSYLESFDITDNNLKLKYLDPNQGELSPGIGIREYPGVASSKGYFPYNVAACYGRPISYELEFKSNPAQTNKRITYSGYTNFGDFRGTEFPNQYNNTETGYVQRYAAGIVKNYANIETCGTEDIIFGVLFTGSATSGTGHIVINGNIIESTSTNAKVLEVAAYGELAWNGFISGLGANPQGYDYIELNTTTYNDPYYSDVSLLLPMNGANNSTTFTDYSPVPNIVTVNGNAKISTAQFKWGGSSGLFDGTTDWLYSPVGTGNFLGSNFTVEGWFNWTALTNGGLFHVYPGTPAGTLEGLAVGYDGTAFQVYSGATNHSRAYTPVVGTWYHVALVRVSGSLTLYVNGIAQGATISDGVSYGGNGINVGLYYSSGFTFNGYMNDFRVTIGIARYTSNFAVPAAPFEYSATLSSVIIHENTSYDPPNYALDVFKTKWAWYYHFVPDAGPGTYCGTVEAYTPMMYTHPGWPILTLSCSASTSTQTVGNVQDLSVLAQCSAGTLPVTLACSYTSTDDDVLTIDQYGQVTGVFPGTATVNISYQNFTTTQILSVIPMTATILANLSASGWNQDTVNGGTITGPAPLGVFFDATDTIHPDASINTYRELGYHFDFGYATPSTPGNWTYNGEPKGNQIGGPMAAHTYQTVGTYVASVRAQDQFGNYSDKFVVIEVQDPDEVYSGTATICISLIGDFTGTPVGAVLQTTVPTTLLSNKRYLFKCNEDYSAVTTRISQSISNVQIASYGVGDKPIIKLIPAQTPPTKSQIRQHSISVYGIKNSGTLSAQFADYVVYLNCEVVGGQGFQAGTLVKYRYENPIGNQDATQCTWPKNIIWEGCYIDALETGYCGYFLATRYAVLGNYGINPAEHVIRIPLTYKGIVAHNYLGAIQNNTKAQLKMHSSGAYEFTYDTSVTRNPMSRYMLVADNYVPPDVNNWQFNMQPQNAQSYEVLQDGIYERNYFASNPIAPGYQKAETAGANRITYRDTIVEPRPASNNIGRNNHSDPGGSQGGIPPELMGPYYVPSGNDLIDYVQVFPNSPTVTPSKTEDAIIVTNQSELNTQLSKSVSELEGKTIFVQINEIPYIITRSGTPNVRNKDFGTGGLTIAGYGAGMPIFSEINLDGTSNCTLYRLEVANTVSTSGTLISIYEGNNALSGSTNITIDSCKIHGKYYDPNADYSAGWGGSSFGIRTFNSTGLYIRNLMIKDCEIYDCDEAFNTTKSVDGDYLKFIGNTVYRCRTGGLNITSTVVPTLTQISWNVMSQNFGDSGDLPDLPHVDFIQFQGGAVDRPNIEIDGNIIFHGNSRGDSQGIFLDDMDAGKYFTAKVRGNVVVSKTYSAISVRNARNCEFINNTVITASPGQAVLSRIVCGDGSDGGGNIVKNSVAPFFLLGGSVSNINNYDMLGSSSTEYATLFDGPTFNASDMYTREAVLSALSMKVGGGLDVTTKIGAVGSGYVNFNTRTLNEYVPTVIVTNQTELNTELAKTGAQLEGQVIGLVYNTTPYVINRNGAGSVASKDFGTGGLVLTQYGPVQPIFSRIAVDACKNLTLHSLEVTSTATSGALIYIYTHVDTDGITIDSCNIHGTYQDPNGDYTVSAYPSTLRGIAYLTGGGGPSISNITIKDCTIYDLRQGIELNKMLGAISIVRNEIYNCYLEPMQLSGGVSVPTTCDVSWNVMYQSIALLADVGAPHADFIQFQGSARDWTGITLIGNIMFKGSARSAGQGIFMDDMDPGYYFTADIKGNLIVQDTFNRGISIQQARNCKIIGNTVAMAYAGQTASPGIFCGEYSDGGGCIVKNNVSKSFTLTSAIDINNYQIPAQTSLAYSQLFAGTSFTATDLNTKEKILSALSMKVSGPLDSVINIGAVGSGYVDFNANSIDTSME